MFDRKQNISLVAHIPYQIFFESTNLVCLLELGIYYLQKNKNPPNFQIH